MTTEDNQRIIDSLIEQGKSFAIWRIPGEDVVHFRMQSSGSPCLIYNIEDLNKRSGFVIAPFRVCKEHPIVLIQPDCFSLPEFTEEKAYIRKKKEFLPEEIQNSSERNEKERYAQCFSIFSQTLHKGDLDKLVLSRNRTIDKKDEFSPGAMYYAAVKRYIRSYIYLCHTPATGTWIGSTPEILLAGNNGQWQTVALAGTQPIQNEEIPKKWDDKNWREQQLVAFYIRHQLASLNIRPHENGPYAIRAGEVSHLKSDFNFSLPDSNKLGNVLALLHPTPAVCGLPKKEAYQFILKNEGYDRSYYSGFIGWLEPQGRTDLYVNLRCMHIEEKALTLYAGGGLLASSALEDEWQETQDKMQTMQRLLK